ncbi:predicted protein [Histoplasma capsulatum var. duboisii H88]|uniref:Predicted protein n=1 Tax=Ajellomyces capsulatus (strain H88) TaxID=544711 RepID=F0UN49_AJEC8|nr:predicted protein [Histoplasma capsulatum var. duboisii H88]
MVHRLGCGEVSSFQYQEEKGGPDWRGLQQPAIPTQKSKLYLTRGLVWGRVGNSRQDGGWCWWLRAAFAGRYGLVPFRLSLEDERNRGSSFLIFGVPSKTERGQLPATARDGGRQSGASGKGGTTNATIPDPPDPGTLSDQATEDTVTGRSCVPAREK